MRITKSFLVALAAFLVISLAACDELFLFDFDIDDYRYRFNDTFEADLEGVDSVSITIVNGYINVETWSSQSVDIDIEERIKAPDEERAEEMADEIRLEGRRVGSELRIEIDYGDFHHKRRYYACNLEVRMPSDIDLSLHTTNGKLQIDEMDGRVRASTTNGSIDLDGCGGDAELDSTNGKITTGPVEGDLHASITNGSIEIEGAAGDVRASTTNGAIKLEVKRGNGFRINASTTNGRVAVDLPDDEFTGEFNRRHTRVEGRYGDGRHRIELRTTNGGIRISER